MVTGIRQTADQRRASVLKAAVTEFAHAGYAGTSTETIAARAGISQPYLFRLFGTKKDLFIATNDLVGERIIAELEGAAEGLDGTEALMAMGEAYHRLMEDAELLQVQMNGFAAATADPEIAASCRKVFEVLWHIVRERTGLPDDEIRQFFAAGMMISVASAINLLSISDHWARTLCVKP